MQDNTDLSETVGDVDAHCDGVEDRRRTAFSLLVNDGDIKLVVDSAVGLDTLVDSVLSLMSVSGSVVVSSRMKRRFLQITRPEGILIR